MSLRENRRISIGWVKSDVAWMLNVIGAGTGKLKRTLPGGDVGGNIFGILAKAHEQA